MYFYVCASIWVKSFYLSNYGIKWYYENIKVFEEEEKLLIIQYSYNKMNLQKWIIRKSVVRI